MKFIFLQFEAIRDYLPDWQGGAGNIVNLITIFVVMFLIAAISGVVIYFIYSHIKYNRKIVIFEKIAGVIQPVKKDKARIVKLGEGGDTIFLTRRGKTYLPTPRIQSGKRVYWYFLREDGEMINFGLGDIDEQMKAANAHYLDKEMRYSRTALQRNLKERYQKMNFWEKYGGVVTYTVLIVLVGIMTWLLFDKWIELSGSVVNAVQTAEQVMERANEILIRLDNIQSGGSGIVSASILIFRRALKHA